MENEGMKDRIAHIIRAKNLTAAEFAIRLGIQPSNISHLLSGRNNPSLDFVRKLKETFPEYNLDWIIFGTGPMTVSEPFVTSSTIVEPLQPESGVESSHSNPSEGNLMAPIPTYSADGEQCPSRPSEWKKLVLVYEDNTFEVLLPR